VAKNAFQIFKVALEESRFYKGNVMPNDDDIWADLAKDCIKKIQENLKKYAEAEDLAYTSLACTLIVVVYSPIGMLVAHVGDGRAGYKNEAGKWLPIMTPHKGEEANQTVFITSSFFENRLLLSGLEVPEMRVIREIPYAFTLMSDGCEKASFLCSVFNKDEQKWTDPNLPFPGFFDPLIDQLRTIAPKHEKLETKLRAIEDNSQNKANSIWQQFLEGGMPQLAEESDDKTMIVGILL
ncbi:MAG: hypothetical protein EBX41_09395, partial [Chitinophagia bacterium]|nr:hypothetical protein [Chitinophagia bacterium]